MKHLVKMQDQYRAQGFIIIAAHSQDVPQDMVVALCKAKGVNYTVLSGGGPQGDESTGIPHAWLFDANGKCVREGHPEEMSGTIDELVKSEPHWTTRGRKLETAVKAIPEALKQGKPLGW